MAQPTPPAALLSRRRILGGGLFLVFGTAATLLVGHRPLSALDSPCLGSGPRRTLEAALEVLLADPERAASLADGVDNFLASDDPVAASQLRMALGLLEHVGGGWGRFSRLDASAREAVLQRWEASRISTLRQVFQALRRLAAFSGYSDPRSWAEIGYEGTWLEAAARAEEAAR